jgi:hypothetical protein
MYNLLANQYHNPIMFSMIEYFTDLLPAIRWTLASKYRCG